MLALVLKREPDKNPAAMGTAAARAYIVQQKPARENPHVDARDSLYGEFAEAVLLRRNYAIRKDAAPRPPPPTRRPPAPPPAQAVRPRTADLGYTARCARSRPVRPVRRSAPVAPVAPVVRYRMDTVVGRIEYRPTRPAPKCTDVPSFLRRPAKLLTPA